MMSKLTHINISSVNVSVGNCTIIWAVSNLSNQHILSIIPDCFIQVGDSVRVNPHLPAPSQGWGKLNGSSVGEISHLADSSGVDTEVSVCFEDDVEWTGIVGDLELVKKLYTGDYVQVNTH